MISRMPQTATGSSLKEPLDAVPAQASTHAWPRYSLFPFRCVQANLFLQDKVCMKVGSLHLSTTSEKNMWRHHTTLNFDHTEKWCHHTIFGVNIIYFSSFFWSHHLMFDHTTWDMDNRPSRVIKLYIVDHTTRLAYHTIDILFTPYVVNHTIYLVSHQQGTIIPYLCVHTKTVWCIP